LVVAFCRAEDQFWSDFLTIFEKKLFFQTTSRMADMDQTSFQFKLWMEAVIQGPELFLSLTFAYFYYFNYFLLFYYLYTGGQGGSRKGFRLLAQPSINPPC